MSSGADVLWRVNSEYWKRLAQAQTYLDLLEQLIAAHNGERYTTTLETLRYVRDQLKTIMAEHRDWRYRFFYESAETKRMVQGDREVNQALSRFARMRSQHESRLTDLSTVMGGTNRPDPKYTRVPNGDLWVMTQYALSDLLGFDDYVSNLEQIN
jgi:rubrerythrin